ncbi:MAG: fibronectin type III domain-containing protein [Treponema sp.]|nr:fibronectin type III domain-containing protein [Treponema sp.]
MNKHFSFFYTVVLAGAFVCLACDPDANDPSVNFVIENLSSYDLYNVKLLNESFVTAGGDFLAKNTPSASVRLLPETGRRITFALASGGSASELTVSAPIAISLRDNRFVIENSTMVVQDGGETCALSEVIAPPSNVMAEAMSSISIRVSWSAVAAGAVYAVSRSTGGAYSQIGGGAPIAETSYVDTGLDPGVTYYYKVTAQSADGKRASGASAPASATTKPGAPSLVSAVAQSSTGITVSWSAVTGASSYAVYRAASGGGQYARIATVSTGTSYADTGLEPDATYYYKVAAFNASGAGEQSAVASATTKKAPPVASATPVSSKSIAVNWSAVTGASSYAVYRAASGGGQYARIATVSTGTSYADTGLEPDATYYYKVSAVYNGEEGGMPETAASAATLPPPSAPSGVTAAADSATSVRLSWSAAPNAAAYKIYYGTAADAVTTYRGETSDTTFTVGDLSTWTPYYFAVSSVDSEGVEGAKSTAEAAATPRDPDATLSAMLSTLASVAQHNGTYTIEIAGNESLAPTDLSYGAKTVTVILTGGGSERTVSLSGAGRLFSIKSGVTLVLDANITLKGHSSNNDSLIEVNTGGFLIMKDGSKITGNTAAYGGGGVYVAGTFTMDGGTISGNTVPAGYVGGAVAIGAGGVFVMNGGTISGNTAGGGGGVGTGSSSGVRTFTMNGGAISGNTSTSGGGIYIGSGAFTLKGGTVSNNTAASSGGGVLVDGEYSGSLTLSGGTISGNRATGDGYVGGGVGINGGATFTMTSGTISGNRATSGGGVGGTDNTNGGRLVMSGGTISANAATGSSSYSGNGGGVYLQSQYTLIKSGGTIYGSNGGVLSNTAGDGGAAVYIYISGTTKRIRNATAGASVSLDSAKTGGAGGWE